MSDEFTLDISGDELSSLCEDIVSACLVSPSAASVPAAAPVAQGPKQVAKSVKAEPQPVKTEREFRTPQGERVVSSLTDAECADLLQSKADRGHDFSSTLLAKRRQFGSWTDGQAAWAHKLAIEEECRRKAEQNIPGEPAGSLSPSVMQKIVDLMSVPGSRLKNPSIMLQLDQGNIKFSVAGSRSKHPGSINITDGGDFGKNKWFGRIHRDGEWEPARRNPMPEWMSEFIHAFAMAPEGTIKAYGKKSGCCCFCRRKLEQPAALSLGMGEVCADHYGFGDAWREEKKRLGEAD